MKKYMIPKIIFFVSLLIFGLSFIMMHLWNSLMPEIFKGAVTTITYGQALGLLVLSKIIFSGFGRGGHGGPPPWARRRWAQKWEEKMKNMSPEEREKFNEAYQRRCGSMGGNHWHHPWAHHPWGGKPWENHSSNPVPDPEKESPSNPVS